MKKKKRYAHKEDMFLKITVIQVIAALIVFAVIFSVSKINSSLFSDIKRQFAALIQEDFDYNDFVPFVQNEVFGYSTEDTTVQQESTVQTQESRTEETEGEETSKESTAEESVSEEESISASGGEDLSIDEGLEIMNFEKYYASECAVYPVNGTVTSEFGYRTHPIYGTQGLHSGKDIAAAEGTNIYCALDGTVLETGVGEKSGNYIKVEHEGGVITLYAHCKEILVNEGIRVRKGEKIALVGATGLVTGPHLHFEVIINSEKCDPDYLLENAIIMDEGALCVSQ